jgi:Formamidopyrimidine-DNA glycosylase
MALELPEMMKISNQLKDVLVDRTIKRAEISEDSKKIIEWGFTNLDKKDITNMRVVDVHNKGHYVFIRFESGYSLIFGDLIGKILYHQSIKDVPEKYKIIFELSDGAFMTFHTSLYGYAMVLNDEEISRHKYIGQKGVSPLSSEFTYEYFTGMLDNNQKQMVKRIQSMYDYISGFLNGYFQDVLFTAGILPARKICDLKEDEKVRLYNAIRDVMERAVKMGGSSEEVDIYNTSGGYTRIMGSGFKDKRCPQCGSVIKKKNILGSSSYYCENCQR